MIVNLNVYSKASMLIFSKKLEHTFSFWSSEISEGILRNQNFFIGLDSFSNHRLIWTHLDYTSYCIDYPVENCKIIVHVAKSIGSLKRLKKPKPRYGPSPFS